MEENNIIYLEQYRSNLITNSDDSAESRPLSLNYPIVIEALRPEDAFCMSLELHELSRRYAFLSFYSLDKEVFETHSLFMGLGPVSVLIDDIESISMDLQEQIYQRIRMTKNQSRPEFILATTDSIANLKQSKFVHSELLTELTVGYIHMDKPFSYYKKNDLKKFFSENLQYSNHLP